MHTLQLGHRCAPLEGCNLKAHSHSGATLLSVEGSPGSQNSMSLSGHLLSNCGDIGLEIGRQAAWIPRANHVLALYITHPIQAVSCSQMSQGKNLLGNAPVTFRAVRRVCGHGGAILGGLATHCDGCAPV
jgi:hypothetical protein